MTGAFNPYGASLSQQRAQALAAQQGQIAAYQAQSASAGMLAAGLGYTSATTTSSSGMNNIFFVTNSSTTTMGTAVTSIPAGSVIPLYANQHISNYHNSPLIRDALRLMGDCSIEDGESATITMPDGSKIEVFPDGSYVVNDKDAKVIYRANRVRDFNPFLNASDKIEEFIQFCGDHGVRKGEMLELPIKLFVGWLVIEAARADREPEPLNVPLLADLRRRAFARCRSCGRFMNETLAAKKIEFCATVCFDRSYQKALAA